MDTSGKAANPARLSASAYFICVALLMAMGIGVAMVLRPAFAHSIRLTLGLEKPPRALPNSFYTARVAPLFEEHCAGCHGARRQKADLRLDSFAAAMRGGRDGPVFVQGDWKNSELMTRLLLPPENDKAMPPEGKPRLNTDEVKVIKLWVVAGASGTLPVAAIKGVPPPVRKIEFPEIDAAAVAQARAPLAHAVEQLQARFPGVLSYESRSSADLYLNAALLGHVFADPELAAFGPVRERIVWADLSGTSISDASAQALGQYKRLRTLRLANTDISDSTAPAIEALTALKSLTVVGTALSESNLAALRARGIRIYDENEASNGSNTAS